MPRLEAGAATIPHALTRDGRPLGTPGREDGRELGALAPKAPLGVANRDECKSMFVSAARREDAATALSTRRWVVARVAEPIRAGRLGSAIDDAVEAALALRGAVPPAVDVDAEAEAALRDRVLRVRALDRPGLAVILPPLGALTDGGGSLSAADSAALWSWIDASTRAPVALILDDADRETVALAPVTLSRLVAAVSRAGAAAAAPMTEALARATGARPIAAPPATVVMVDMEEPTEDARETLPGTAPDEDAPTPLVPPVHVCEPEDEDGEVGRETSSPDAPGEPEPPEDEEDDEPTTALAAPAPMPRQPARVAAPTPEAEEPAPNQKVISAAEWRTLAVELDAARGPKPARQIDRLFVTRYLPLLGAVARGEVDGTVRGIVEAWRQSFEHSYKEGFPALRVTGKRPPMVLDAPDVAAKIGRLNGARSVKLLLVDAMRFDLGERIMTRLGPEVAGRALCVERVLLWSALPSVTQTQMTLLARGPEGLREPAPNSEREPDIARGRAISTLRRERIGARELLKLDLVEARLRSTGPAHDARLEAIAAEVVPVLARCIDALPPRTLLFVFGDHGFRLPASADGRTTGPATQGEASPEEIIVPGYALLTGGTH